MSTNYTKLKKTILDYLARDDIPDAAINTFIDVVEQNINANFSPKELDAMAILDIEEDNSVWLPEDYRLSRMVQVDDSEPLEQIDPQSFFQMPDSRYITTIGEQMFFGGGVSGKTARILYSRRLPALYDAEENVISKLYPSLYIFGCLREAAAYIDDKAKQEYYDAKYTATLEAAMVDADQARYSGSRLAWRSSQIMMGGQ